MRKNRSEVIDYINSLKEYEGFVQFSHRAIDLKKDLFPRTTDIELETEQSFVYEAHFFNGTDSIMIRQVNDGWLISKSENISLEDVQTYHAIGKLQVKMAQIWKSEPDELCDGMKVMRLKKVVFAGFKK